MAFAAVNGIDLWYDTLGDPADEPLLLINGLGSQAITWDDELREGLVDRGFYVIRFDNRDVGLSTKIDAPVDLVAAVAKARAGELIDSPYTIGDMAADAIALLDHLDVAAAHVLGMSMGSRITQHIAVNHPDRVKSLSFVMAGLPADDAPRGPDRPEVAARLLQAAVVRPRDEAIDHDVETRRFIGSPDHFDEDRARARAAAAYDRSYDPPGVGRQMLAIAAAGQGPSLAKPLAQVARSTIVIHGAVDPLADPGNARRLAETIPDAELLMIDDMGHDLPPALWPQIIDAVTRTAAR